VTFLLTEGGHNAGIVSEPGHPRRSYQIAKRTDRDLYVDPDTWAAQTPKQVGSWWPAWVNWLGEHSGERVRPPDLGARDKGYAAEYDAPGTYVFEA